MNTETDRPTPIIYGVRALLFLALGTAVCWLGYSIGRQGREGGETADVAQGTSVYLLKEPVERAGYFNEWWAHLEEHGETEIVVVGEGKLVAFRGSLRLNTETQTVDWQGAQNFGQVIPVAEIERLVPQQAIENLWAWNGSR